MGAHALLSPSSAKRWIACTPSARLESRIADKGSVFADEGTLAHRLAEAMTKHRLGRISNDQYAEELLEIIEHELYQHEMVSYVEDYVDFIWEQWNEARERNPDAEIFTEERIDLRAYIPEGFGTLDNQIVSDHILTIIDLKYGKGVPVSAYWNDQLMIYALGALQRWSMLFEIHTVRMVIYQPRIDNITTFEISVKDLLEWAVTVLVPAAEKAIKGEGEMVAGEHCRFCRVKPTCPALAAYNLELDKYEFMAAEMLTDEQIADILSRAAMFQNWLTAVEDYALEEAVTHGKEWPGYKLVRGRSNRTYSDREAVVTKLLPEYGPKIYEAPKLLGITAMEGLLGKQNFNTLLKGLVVKPEGKPALVPLSDKREAINSVASAKSDFADVECDLLD